MQRRRNVQPDAKQHGQRNAAGPTRSIGNFRKKVLRDLRLFILMGLTWIFEIISYSVRKNTVWAKRFQVADYLNWSQGIIIFVLFILKPSTLKLLKNM